MRRLTITVNDEARNYPNAVLCRDLSFRTEGRQVTLRRGTSLYEALEAARSSKHDGAIHVVVPEDGDISQEDASALIAKNITGTGLHCTEPHQGQVNIMASEDGVFRASGELIHRLNQFASVLIATSLDGRVVQKSEVVAIVKASELMVHESRLRQSLHALISQPVMWSSGFVRQRVGLIAGERIRDANLKVSSRQLATGLAQFGAELSDVRRSDDDPSAISQHYQEMVSEGIELILVAGSIVLDPEDPYLTGLKNVHGRLVQRGAPIDPGTMFWVAYVDTVPLFGLASCELYGKLSIFDLFLPYALAGEEITADLMASLGYGGLIEQTQRARRPADWTEES